MNELSEMALAAVQDAEARVGAILVWDGDNFPCAGGEAAFGKTLDIGGWKPNADAMIAVRVSLFNSRTAPGLKDIVGYQSSADAQVRQLRVESIREVFGDVLLFSCNDPNTGA